VTTRSQLLGAALKAQGLDLRGLFWLVLAVFGTLPLFQLGFQVLAEPDVERTSAPLMASGPGSRATSRPATDCPGSFPSNALKEIALACLKAVFPRTSC
jgi:hypothetical protein